jgi:hypothetical protein
MVMQGFSGFPERFDYEVARSSVNERPALGEEIFIGSCIDRQQQT